MSGGTIKGAEPIDVLKRIPFVRSIHEISPTAGANDGGHDGTIDVQTPSRHFRLLVQAKRSFLTRSDVNQLLAWAKQVGTGKPRGVILLARHIPRPVAERLVEARVNFADDAGNIHLALGDRYSWTVFGRPPVEPFLERRPITAAQLQLLFQFATHPQSTNWPVRRLETAAGISKSKAAQARRQLTGEGLLNAKGRKYELAPKNLVAHRLTSGYAQVLRPKLVIGRFQFAEGTPELFLNRLRKKPPPGVKYALTGSQAADLLQHFYRGPDVQMFIEPTSRNVTRELRLLPDRHGPLTLLRAFGEAVFWQDRDHHTLASPWLIYAELLTSNDPRAHEAASVLQRELSL